jgi:predicted enzyme related to lactoylglutathione lyase
MRFSGVMIGSDNPRELAAFYAKILGEPNFQDGDWHGWNNGAQMMIGAHDKVSGKNTVPQRIMLCVEVDDVKESFEMMKALGAKVVAEPYMPSDDDAFWLATIEDTDGNYLQLSPPWTM